MVCNFGSWNMVIIIFKFCSIHDIRRTLEYLDEKRIFWSNIEIGGWMVWFNKSKWTQYKSSRWNKCSWGSHIRKGRNIYYDCFHIFLWIYNWIFIVIYIFKNFSGWQLALVITAAMPCLAVSVVIMTVVVMKSVKAT